MDIWKWYKGVLLWYELHIQTSLLIQTTPRYAGAGHSSWREDLLFESVLFHMICSLRISTILSRIQQLYRIRRNIRSIPKKESPNTYLSWSNFQLSMIVLWITQFFHITLQLQMRKLNIRPIFFALEILAIISIKKTC